jgi:hypothetical protein
MKSRKFTHKKLKFITMKQEEIRMAEDEWNRRYNINTNIVG